MLWLQTLKDPKRQKVYAKKYENSKVARFLRAKLAITRYRHLSQMRAGLFWHLYPQFITVSVLVSTRLHTAVS